MNIIKYGNDINVTWKIYGRNGVKYSLSDRVYSLWLVNGPRKKEITSYTIQARNELVFVIDSDDMSHYGAYKLILQLRETESNLEGETYDLTQVFQIVSTSYPMITVTAIDGVANVVFTSVLKNVYVSSLEGESAYEIAVRNGFEGSETEWLASLVGVIDAEQVATSADSGGVNTMRFTLADNSTVDFNVRNGSAGSAGSSTLAGLSDVTVSSPSSGQVLKWNGSRWVNGSAAAYSYGSGITISGSVISANYEQIASGLIDLGYNLSGGEGGSTGGSTTLQGLADVNIVQPQDGQVLAYDGATSRWIPKTVSSGESGGGGGGSDIDTSGFVTIADSQTITGAKTFSSQIIGTSSLIVGSGTTALAEGAAGAVQRIYFGDANHYLEYNTNGFFFYGGGVYTNSFVSAGGYSSGGGGGTGGATTLAALTDVNLDDYTPADGQALVFDASLFNNEGGWRPGNVASSASGKNVFYGSMSQTETANVWTATCNGFTEDNLVAGTVLYLYPTNSSTYTPTGAITLNVNSTGAKSAYTALTGYYAGWSRNTLLVLVYDGTNWRSNWNLGNDNNPGYARIVATELSGLTGWTANNSGGVACSIYTAQKIYEAIAGSGSGASYYAGTGLSLSGTTFNLTKATTSTLGGVKAATSSNSSVSTTVASSGTYYAVGVDSNGKMYVRVPSSSSDSVSPATASSYGTVKPMAVRTPSNVSYITGGTTSNRYYGVEMNSSGQLYVNVPWIESSGDSGSYLPLAGGTMTGTINSQSVVPKTDATYNLGSTAAYYNYAYTKRIYLASDVYLEYDSDNDCVRVYGAGLAAEGVVTAGLASS